MSTFPNKDPHDGMILSSVMNKNLDDLKKSFRNQENITLLKQLLLRYGHILNSLYSKKITGLIISAILSS